MSSETATATKTRSKCPVAPWGIEADTMTNGDVILKCLRPERLRGRIVPSKTRKHPRTGDEFVPATAVPNFPEVPGMQLHVNPAVCEWKIIDPLRGNEELCAKILRRLKQLRQQSWADKLDGVPSKSGKVDIHMMKSLCREMWHLVTSGDARLVKGILPSMEDIEAMDGDFLLEPGSNMNTSRPKFEKDLPEYIRNLGRLGT